MAIGLAKDSEAADLEGVTKLGFGAQWTPSAGNSGRVMGALRRRKGVDLDLIGIALAGERPVRLAGLDSLDPFGNGALTHTGDNFTGAGEGDDELAEVDFTHVPDIVTAIVFIGSAFKKGSSFAQARNVEFNVYDSSNGSTQKVAYVWPSLLGQHNACAVAIAYRDGVNWKFKVIEEFGSISQGDDQSLMRFAAKYANVR